MRICVYDNLANNAYIITKFLRKMGYNAEVGLVPTDTFPMSQPIWEDMDFEMPVDQSFNKSIDFWLNFETENGWERPNWIKYIGRPTFSRYGLVRSNLVEAFTHPMLTLKAFTRTKGNIYDYLHTFLNVKNFSMLSDYDFVIGFGIGPSLAYLAEVRYASIPYGGDLTIVPFQINDPKWFIRARAKLQRIAYQKSEVIFVGDPDYVLALKRMGVSTNWVNYRYPIDSEKYRQLRKQHLDELIDTSVAERTANKTILLMPSRLDFGWKGSDRVIKAFAKLVKERQDAFLVMLQWGSDFERAKEMVSELGITDYVYFHPYLVSKPRLIRFINAADIVLDQFALGSYGTSTMESMACGKPLITHIDWEKYKTFLPDKPPVMLAATEGDIFEAMLALCKSSELRERLGQLARDWIIANHSEKNFSDAVKIINA